MSRSSPIADQFAVGFRSSFDRPATRTRHAHADLRSDRQPGLRLDSVMEFGLNRVEFYTFALNTLKVKEIGAEGFLLRLKPHHIGKLQ